MHQAGIVAEQIDVAIAVRVEEKRAFAARDGQRVRTILLNRAGVAAGHHALRALRDSLRRLFVMTSVPRWCSSNLPFSPLGFMPSRASVGSPSDALASRFRLASPPAEDISW